MRYLYVLSSRQFTLVRVVVDVILLALPYAAFAYTSHLMEKLLSNDWYTVWALICALLGPLLLAIAEAEVFYPIQKKRG